MNTKQTLLAAAAILASGFLPTAGADPGRNLAAACAACHGTNGQSPGAMPTLAGKHKEQILAELRSFRDGNRPATVMHQIARGYTEQQYDLIAAYFAAQRPAALR